MGQSNIATTAITPRSPQNHSRKHFSFSNKPFPISRHIRRSAPEPRIVDAKTEQPLPPSPNVGDTEAKQQSPSSLKVEDIPKYISQFRSQRNISVHEHQLGPFNLSPEDLERLEEIIQKAPELEGFRETLKFHYFPVNQELYIQMGADKLHQEFIRTIAKHFTAWLPDEKVSPMFRDSYLYANDTLELTPDIGFGSRLFPRKHPSVVVEIAYSETYKNMKEKARIYVTSGGHINTVISLKLGYPKDTDKELMALVTTFRRKTKKIRQVSYEIRNSAGQIQLTDDQLDAPIVMLGLRHFIPLNAHKKEIEDDPEWLAKSDNWAPLIISGRTVLEWLTTTETALAQGVLESEEDSEEDGGENFGLGYPAAASAGGVMEEGSVGDDDSKDDEDDEDDENMSEGDGDSEDDEDLEDDTANELPILSRQDRHKRAKKVQARSF